MSEPVIKCESVYKIFGQNAKKMLEESNGNVDAKTFQKKGCDLSRKRAQIFRLILPNIVTENMWGCRAAKTAVPGRFIPTAPPFGTLFFRTLLC